jgi:hypothetical protein
MHLRNDPEIYRRWDGRSLTGQLAALLSGSSRQSVPVAEMPEHAARERINRGAEPQLAGPNVADGANPDPIWRKL